MEKTRTIVITGASAGVGRATAAAFARQGASIGLIARGRAGLEGARREVEALGGRAVAVAADVADAAQVAAAAAQIEDQLGPVDVWVNNAMASVFSPIKEMTPDEFRRVTEVTYLGVVYGTLCALRRMLPRNRGSIVQVGSALAYRGIPLQAAYCGAKHAIQGFCDSLRTELLHDKSAVRVTMVQLPAMNTPQFDWVKSRLRNRAQPVPPIYQPEVAANAIVWASEHNRREIYVGLSTEVAIVGNKAAPSLGDWYLAKHGYESQQTSEPDDPERPNNLWHPVDDGRDFGAHGRFTARAEARSRQTWLTEHRGVAIAVAFAAAAALVAACASSRR
ncbi:MAG TPA: SDR family oxidoreductase [Vicinamibacterales bacterium]|jgi:short-subunit dehydrogenase|nr:SDR family oxidoreductase [Vicinamibacterales bacterium]